MPPSEFATARSLNQIIIYDALNMADVFLTQPLLVVVGSMAGSKWMRGRVGPGTVLQVEAVNQTHASGKAIAPRSAPRSRQYDPNINVMPLQRNRGDWIRTSDILNPILSAEAATSRRISQMQAFW